MHAFPLMASRLPLVTCCNPTPSKSLACGGILWILFIGVGISGKAMQDNQLKKQMDPDVYELRKRLAR